MVNKFHSTHREASTIHHGSHVVAHRDAQGSSEKKPFREAGKPKPEFKLLGDMRIVRVMLPTCMNILNEIGSYFTGGKLTFKVLLEYNREVL